MDAKAAAAISDQGVSQKLKDAIEAAKQSPSDETPKKSPEVILQAGEKTAPGGGKKVKGGEKWDVSTGKESSVGDKEKAVEKTDDEKDVDVELNSILKRSPSKSSTFSYMVK